jgi:hypothetical protein
MEPKEAVDFFERNEAPLRFQLPVLQFEAFKECHRIAKVLLEFEEWIIGLTWGGYIDPKKVIDKIIELKISPPPDPEPEWKEKLGELQGWLTNLPNYTPERNRHVQPDFIHIFLIRDKIDRMLEEKP